jgi:hypothetical protein
MAVTGTGVRVVGIERVVKNLNREIRRIRGRTKTGLWLAAQYVKGASLVKTPVDTGHLRQSAYVTAFDSSAGPGAEIGYTAAYAVYVHEIDKNYRAPGTSWKFLERALMESRKAILEIIARTSKVRRGR